MSQFELAYHALTVQWRRRKIDPSTLTVEQIDRSLRAGRWSVATTTLCCAGLAAFAFSVGLTLFGAFMVLVGAIGAPLVLRLLKAEHTKLRAKATDNPFGGAN
jgi:Flp pilus assembly protein TadB